MKKQKGQIILILILVITVALAIGLSVIQRSLVDVSTSTKVEQSARAFSAAEAGIEKALKDNSSGSVQFTETGSQAIFSAGESIPVLQTGSDPQKPLEYPTLSKEEIAQAWLADLYSDSNPPAAYYTQNSLDIFWGQQNIADVNNRPAIEIKVIEYIGGTYTPHSFYLDPNSSRASLTNFTDVSSGCSNTLPAITTTSGTNRSFYCKWTLSGLKQDLMLLRARILYSSTSQPFAVGAVGTCGRNCSLPSQARILTSTGTSGETQRKVQVFRLDKVIPAYFDYALFSVGEIKKTGP